MIISGVTRTEQLLRVDICVVERTEHKVRIQIVHSEY